MARNGIGEIRKAGLIRNGYPGGYARWTYPRFVRPFPLTMLLAIER
jgi:hypothetical protein